MQLVDLVFDENDLWGPGGPEELHGLPHHDETGVPLSAAKFFDQEGPTSSSSEGAPSGSSGRDSTTPGATSQSGATVDPSSAAAGASWMQMAPNLPDFQPQSAGFYSVTPQQQAVAPQWHSSVQWHSAFSSAMPPAPAASQQVVSKESKGTVSHSTIEKQRRDRINSLIDELRDLVPPSAAVKSPDGGDAKRPKHVVLSDTIALLRHLKEKVQQDELERQRLQLVQQQMAAVGMVSAEAMAAGQHQAQFPTGILQAASNGMVPGVMSLPSAMEATTLSGAVSQQAQTLLQHSLSGSLSSYTAALPPAAAFGPSSCPELPQAPPNLPSAVGVLVEEGPGPSFLVKVNCRDRHGLLSDITQALCGLPLQISRAAITTGTSGAVYDVFEIVAEPSAGQGHESVTALDVQFHVHQALHKRNNGNPGAAEQPGSIAIGKRQRL